MTRRRMLALGAAGLGALAVGDGGQETTTVTRPLARGRAVIRPRNTGPRLPRPGVMPPRLAPVPARKEVSIAAPMFPRSRESCSTRSGMRGLRMSE